MRALPLTLMLTCGLLSACEDFSERVPGTPQTPGPSVDARFIPPAGFWTGAAAAGPWCAAAAPAALARPPLDVTEWKTGTRGLEEASPDAASPDAASPNAANLKGASLKGANVITGADLALQTHDHEALEAWLIRRGARLQGRSGSFVLSHTSAEVGRQAVELGLATYAERLPELELSALPTPTESGDPSTESYFKLTGVSGAWAALEQGCAPVVVAVVDTGWSSDPAGHEANLAPRSAWFNAVSGEQGNANSKASLSAGRDHGAQVASVIAQTVNGGGPGYSLGYNLVKVLPVAAQAEDGSLPPAAVALAIDYALGQAVTPAGTRVNPYPASIINLSLGSPGSGSAEESALLSEQARRAAAAGVLMVAAAGNSAGELYNYALAEPTIAVGGLNRDGSRWLETTAPDQAPVGSAAGPELDLAAPAKEVSVTYNRRVFLATGTSFAAPWASAQLALWMYANRQYAGSPSAGLQGDALYSALRRCLAAAGQHPRDSTTGVGAVNTATLVASSGACRP